MSAIKRLVRELLELNNCPIPNISISPINEDNLNDEWHGNITSNSNSENWNGVIIHFKIEFPKEYPKFPPIVSLFSFVPHLNLQLKNGNVFYKFYFIYLYSCNNTFFLSLLYILPIYI